MLAALSTSRFIKSASLAVALATATVAMPAPAQACERCELGGQRHNRHHGDFGGNFGKGLAVGAGLAILGQVLLAEPRVTASGSSIDPRTGERIRVVHTDDGFKTIQRDDDPAIRIKRPAKPKKLKPYEVRRLQDGGKVEFFRDANGNRFAKMQDARGRSVTVDGEIGDRGGNWVPFR